jgi:general secretion pathway protein H
MQKTIMPSNFALRTKGFTLVEVLIVMLIVSIMMGVVVTSVPSSMDSADQETEAERIRTVLQMASDEAVISGFEIGFNAVRKQYNFYQFDDDTLKWLPLDDKPFEEHILPFGVSLELEVEGSDIELGDALTAPPVLILSSGEVTPFHLSVTVDDSEIRSLVVSTDGFSEFKLDPEQ